MPLFKNESLTPKEKNKLQSWHKWQADMRMLKTIHKDIKQKLDCQRVASDWVFREGRFNG